MAFVGMRLFSRPFLLLASILLVILPFPLPALGAAPIVSVTHFANLPSKLFYFDDTSTLLIHDPVLSTVHISQNEGSSWQPVSNVPEGAAVKLVQHPHNNDMAFILGRGKQHWVTHNRGTSWQSFEMEQDASLGGGAEGNTLSFHASHSDWILFQTIACEDTGTGRWGSGRTCWDETYYTKDAFRSTPRLLLTQTSTCMFARSSPAFLNAPESLIFCIAFDQSNKGTAGGGGMHSIKESRLYSSSNFFENGDKTFVNLGIGKKAQGVVGLGVVSKFMVVALKALDGAGLQSRSASGGDPMHLYISTDGQEWKMAKFPHSAMPSLKENAYTIVESTTHSLAIDVLTEVNADIGTLFVSSGDGIYFVEALADTNRNAMGIVDYEGVTGLEGIALANVVMNREEVVGWGDGKKLKSLMTYDDGSTWKTLKPPATKLDGDSWTCDPKSVDKDCTLHLHSVSQPHNFGKIFSSVAPGFIMGVGSVGDSLLEYEDCDTFISSDAGLTWRMAAEGAQKYEFGDQGSIIVIVDDEQQTDFVQYSYDFGQSWSRLDLGVSIRALLLTTIPDSTSQKFLLLGTLARGDANADGRHATIFLDFAPVNKRKCAKKDMERWYARPAVGKECLLGHKQWYNRRKEDAVCYIGDKFTDPVGYEEDCVCKEEDFECDFNFVRSDGECVMRGLEVVPAGQCAKETDTYTGSSGYRKIPGNTCKGGLAADQPVQKSCALARPADGQPSHAVHVFDSPITADYYFPKSTVMLIQLQDGTVWQSSNKGFSWKQIMQDDTILAVLMHPFAPERAYIITDTRKAYMTIDAGSSWNVFTAPSKPNAFHLPIMDFHPTRADWLIYTGSSDCEDTLSEKCRAIAYYSTNNGKKWNKVEEYVRNCAWARDARMKVDEKEILCESYVRKEGSQRSSEYNQLQLIAGQNYYSKKIKLFESVVGFATFSQYLIVAELNEVAGTLKLQVSLDGIHFAEGQFPPSMKIENRAYTILESNTDSVFLHVTMSEEAGNEFGSIFKSNSNGTYYNLAIDHVNRGPMGYVDFEKNIGLDGIAVINIVANPESAGITGQKKLQTRITHNDGATWKPMSPPAKDSLGSEYECTSTSCGLHIHGYTERRDPKATYSSPSAIGLMLAVGNVGEYLADYTESDIFLTRDAGFTWEEVHKDAHMWEVGDSGSVLCLVNDEGPTDHVIYSIDEGLTWSEYSFDDNIRVKSIQTVPTDTSRKFTLFGNRQNQPDNGVIVYLDFSTISNRKCSLNVNDPQKDDMEVWSPSETRDESCLFGRQSFFHRRIRDRDCYIGETLSQPNKEVRNCTCQPSDFECEFNYRRGASGSCQLVAGATPLGKRTTEQEQCDGYTPYWYERTNVRRIPYSSCEGGNRPDRGARHDCPGMLIAASHGFFWWFFMIVIPLGASLLGALWYFEQKQQGAIRLGEHRAYGGDSRALQLAASIPYFVLGFAATSWAFVCEKIPFLDGLFGSRDKYGGVPIDDDAEILNTYEDD